MPRSPSSSESMGPQPRKKRRYTELKITGPPLYRQGSFLQQHDESTYTISPRSCIPLEASRTALLIVDVQPGKFRRMVGLPSSTILTNSHCLTFRSEWAEYWSECPAVRQDFPHFPSRISSLVSHCRSQQTKCIWVRADYNFEKSPWLQQFSRLHQGRIPPIVKPNSKWESFAEPQEDEFVMTKTSWSSTSDTKLLTVLKESGIDTVLVCGLITSVCVQHSAFGIFEAGFRTILVTDACADRGKARHMAALALYGDYMYELRSVESVKMELRSSNDGTMTKPLQSSDSFATLPTTSPSESETSDSETQDDEHQPPPTLVQYVTVPTREYLTASMGQMLL